MADRAEALKELIQQLDELAANEGSELRNLVLGLLPQCPLGGNPLHCQGHKLRLLDSNAQERWCTACSDQELLEIYKCHLVCLKNMIDAQGDDRVLPSYP